MILNLKIVSCQGNRFPNPEKTAPWETRPTTGQAKADAARCGASAGTSPRTQRMDDLSARRSAGAGTSFRNGPRRRPGERKRRSGGGENRLGLPNGGEPPVEDGGTAGTERVGEEGRLVLMGNDGDGGYFFRPYARRSFRIRMFVKAEVQNAVAEKQQTQQARRDAAPMRFRQPHHVDHALLPVRLCAEYIPPAAACQSRRGENPERRGDAQITIR